MHPALPYHASLNRTASSRASHSPALTCVVAAASSAVAACILVALRGCRCCAGVWCVFGRPLCLCGGVWAQGVPGLRIAGKGANPGRGGGGGGGRGGRGAGSGGGPVGGPRMGSNQFEDYPPHPQPQQQYQGGGGRGGGGRGGGGRGGGGRGRGAGRG